MATPKTYAAGDRVAFIYRGVWKKYRNTPMTGTVAQVNRETVTVNVDNVPGFGATRVAPRDLTKVEG